MSVSPDLQSQVTALSARLAVLDGQGLPNPSTAFVATTNAKIKGVQLDLTQSVMSLEGLLTSINISIAGLWAALSTALGITPPPTSAPPTVVPPAG
jgi:hypothetical protein